jgi:uncharacterized protein (TIGR03382 family)
MKSVVALLAVAGLGGMAQAQSLVWMASTDDADLIINPGESITWTLSATMGGNDEFVALAATIFDTLNTNGAGLGGITSWSVLNDLDQLTGDLTTTDGVSLFGTNAGQLTVFGPFTTANPVDILEFTWTSNGSAGDVAYATKTDSAVLWIGPNMDDAVSVDAQATDTEFGWTVVPTPASAALLGLGGLALVRRRR